MQFLGQRLHVPKVLSTAFFHGHGTLESSASTIWFIKVVCTVCISHSHSLTIFDSRYFRENIDPFVAFGVIQRLDSKLCDPSLAFDLFKYLRFNLNVIHTESTYSLLLRSLCRMGLHESAKIVYEFMKSDGLFLNNSILDFLVSYFSNIGMISFAKEILIANAETCDKRQQVVPSFVYNKFLRLLIDRNSVDEAVVFFRGHILRLPSFCPDTCSFNIVMRGLCRMGKVEMAIEFFDIMAKYGCCPDRVSFNTLINGFCRVGNMTRAQELLRDIELHHLFSPDVVTYTSVISGYCKSGNMKDAVSVFDEMIEIGVRPNLFTFNIIIDGFGKRGDVASALKIYKRLVTSGFNPDVVTFTSIIDGHCRLGDLDRGMKLWSEMNERMLTPNVYTFSILINALCKSNRLNESLNLLRQLSTRKDIIPPPFIYNPVIDGFCKSGNLDVANAVVAEMEAKGCVHDKMTFTILILGHCMKGKMFEAIVLYKNMLSVGCTPDNITISSLVSCLRKAGMAREASEIEQTALCNAKPALPSLDGTEHFMTNMNIPVTV